MELNKISAAGRPNINIQMTQEVLNMNNLQIIEEGPQVPQDDNMKNSPILEEASQMSQDINMRDLRIVEEGPRVCPVCSQDVRSYFINYTEKIEMCGNLNCDYPFGFEPLKILREENGVQTVEIKSLTTKGTRSVTGSQASSQHWSEIDKVFNAFEAEDVPSIDFNKQTSYPTPTLIKTEEDRRKAELFMNVEKIKQMTKTLNDMKKEPKGIIKNEIFIKNLEFLEEVSGCNLLKPEEQRKIKKNVSSSQKSELRIDIDKNLASIRIEVNRTSAPNAKEV